MSKNFHSAALATLFVFSVYALSPIYAVFPGLVETAGPAGASCGGIKVGILWVDVVLDALIGGEHRRECSGQEQYLHASTDDDMVLIRKKRAMKERLFRVQPPVRTGVIAAVIKEDPLPAACSYDIPRDLIHDQSRDYHSFSTGVSPPSSLS